LGPPESITKMASEHEDSIEQMLNAANATNTVQKNRVLLSSED